MFGAEDIARLLRPAGQGIYLVSSGKRAQLELGFELYGVATEAEIAAAHARSLQEVQRARVLLLGIPSDTGAGYARGANLGPGELRRSYLRTYGAFPEGVVDVGDVFVVPQLLSDDMCSDTQLARARDALYGNADCSLPVSPLSAAEAVLHWLRSQNPDARLVVLGGDHSVAIPVVNAYLKSRQNACVVHVDAHTDLMASRLGVLDCFATWAHQANEILGRGGRLVQVGIRASGRDKAHWEQTLGVRQWWAQECQGEAWVEDVVSHLHRLGCEQLYFSNDIDGTDAAYASATGTPEPGGLLPAQVRHLFGRLSEEFRVFAADLVEVAPALGEGPEARAITMRTSTGYLHQCLSALLAKQS